MGRMAGSSPCRPEAPRMAAWNWRSPTPGAAFPPATSTREPARSNDSTTPYHRSNNTGTGLGLPLVKGLMELHSGSLCIVPIAYLCVGKVKGYHRQPELEAAGWRPRLPLDQLLHFDQWDGPEPEEALTRLVREDQRSVNQGTFVGALAQPPRQ